MKEYRETIAHFLKKAKSAGTAEEALIWSRAVSHLVNLTHSGSEFLKENKDS